MSESAEAVQNNPVENDDDTTKLTGNEWREMLQSVAPEYVNEWDEFKNADSPEKFFDQIRNHRSMLGQSVRIPSGDAGREQMEEFYSKIQSKVPGLMRTPDPDQPEQVKDVFRKLGAPEKPDDYKLDSNSDLDPETLGAYRRMAHEAGLTKEQFQKFTGQLFSTEAERAKQLADQREQDSAALRGEWGGAYEQRSTIAASVARKTGAPDALVAAVEKGEADSSTMRWLYGLSQQFGQEGVNFTNNQEAVSTPAEIEGQISDILSNNQHPYWDKGHPSHDAAVKRVLDLRMKLSQAG